MAPPLSFHGTSETPAGATVKTASAGALLVFERTLNCSGSVGGQRGALSPWSSCRAGFESSLSASRCKNLSTDASSQLTPSDVSPGVVLCRRAVHNGQVRQTVRHRVRAVPVHRVAIVVFVLGVAFLIGSVAVTSNRGSAGVSAVAPSVTSQTMTGLAGRVATADGVSAGITAPLVVGFGLLVGWVIGMAVALVRRRPVAAVSREGS